MVALTYELAVQQLIQKHHYNTVGNFMRFYGNWKNSGERDVRDFFKSYHPEIVEGEYSCVGLGLELIRRTGGEESGLALVSCEEDCGGGGAGLLETAAAAEAGAWGVEHHHSPQPPSSHSEKEHVLVSSRLQVGGRRGLLLLDPGYHLARVVTVMEDSLYPHTGWFTQTNEPHVKREYRYYLSDQSTDYVIWEVRESRGNKISLTKNLIYVGGVFQSPVQFTEKRNLVYNFKSWLARNNKGEIMAGMYFSLNRSGSEVFTVTCTDENENKLRQKFYFSDFLKEEKKFSVEELEILDSCGRRLGISEDFRKFLSALARVISDLDFISQLLDINEEINDASP